MGVVMYILLSGKVPFPGRNELEIISNVIKGEFHFNHEAFKNISPECKDLICHLLEKDVNQRYNADEAYNHPWIQKHTGGEENLVAVGNENFSSIVFEEMKDVMSIIN